MKQVGTVLYLYTGCTCEAWQPAHALFSRFPLFIRTVLI